MTSQTIPPTPESEDVRALLPAYAIGATDASESARVEDYLRQHPEEAGEASEYAAAASLLMLGIPRRDPPAALRQKLLDAARAQAPIVAPRLQVVPRSTTAQPLASKRVSQRQRPLLAWVSTAAAAVLLVMNVFWMSQVNDLRARQTELEQTNQTQLAALQQINQERITDALTMMVTGTRSDLMDDSGATRALVMWQPGHTEALMFTHSLPVLDSNHTYQLWLIDEAGTPVSAGTFSVDSNGRATLIFDAQIALDAFNAFGISEEPTGGSTAPTTTPLAVGAL